MKYKIWNKTDCSLGLTERGGQVALFQKQFTHQTTVKEQNGNLDLSGDTWNTLPREHGIQCRRFFTI